jgi:hypothetical protein
MPEGYASDAEVLCAKFFHREEIENLVAENKQLKSDLLLTYQNYEHIKQQWEADKTKVKEVLEKYIRKHNELIVQHKRIEEDAVKEFAKRLIDESENGVISIDVICDCVFKG